MKKLILLASLLVASFSAMAMEGEVAERKKEGGDCDGMLLSEVLEGGKEGSVMDDQDVGDEVLGHEEETFTREEEKDKAGSSDKGVDEAGLIDGGMLHVTMLKDGGVGVTDKALRDMNWSDVAAQVASGAAILETLVKRKEAELKQREAQVARQEGVLARKKADLKERLRQSKHDELIVINVATADKLMRMRLSPDSFAAYEANKEHEKKQAEAKTKIEGDGWFS